MVEVADDVFGDAVFVLREPVEEGVEGVLGSEECGEVFLEGFGGDAGRSGFCW